MNEIEYNKELLTEFPFLLPRNVWTGELDEDYDYSYTLLDFAPVGWKKLFLQCCRDLAIQLTKERKLNKFRFTQIKEKYNTLRPIALGCHKDNKLAADFYVRHGFRKTMYMEGNDFYYLRYPER